MKTEDVCFIFNYSHGSDFKKYKAQIEKNGFIPVRQDDSIIVRIYEPYLLELLTTKELSVLNVETKKNVTINGFDYLKTFIQGYIEGRENFDREFGVSPDTLYKNPQYVKDIYHNYFHGKHRKGAEGWEAVKRSIPLIFNHKSIKEFGFDSGIVSKVEEMKEKSPALFENFDMGNHKEVPGKEYFLRIPTKETKTLPEILKFWLDHLSNNKKGEPSLMSNQDIEHFVNQNFKGFPCINKTKTFNPKMTKTELCRITYKFWYDFGEYGTKIQYADMLIKNFERFKKDNNDNLCKNIANR